MANQALVGPPVGRKKPEPDSTGPPKKITTTKVDGDLLRKAKHVAIAKGLDLGEYIDALLRQPIERDYAAFKGSKE